MNYIFKSLIIITLCACNINCKSSSESTKKPKYVKPHSTDDVVEEQIQDYEEAMKQ